MTAKEARFALMQTAFRPPGLDPAHEVEWGDYIEKWIAHAINTVTDIGVRSMKPDWIEVVPSTICDPQHPTVKYTHYFGNKLPPERRMVLVQIMRGDDGEAPCVAVGYIKLAAGEADSPYFVVPGARSNFFVSHWADCLGDDFEAPAWAMEQS